MKLYGKLEKVNLIFWVTNMKIEERVNSDVSINIDYLKCKFSNCSDVIYREINVFSEEKHDTVLIWIDGLTDMNLINDDIVKRLIKIRYTKDKQYFIQSEDKVQNNIVSIADIKVHTKMSEVIDSLLSGNTIIFIDGLDECIIASTRGGQFRSITEPKSESIVRGPMQGFTENIKINVGLIRGIIKNSDLKVESLKLGNVSKTDVTITYIDGIVNESILKEVKKRVNKINLDAILDSSYIEELIEDHPYSPFPQIAHTERPDKVAAHLLEGRVAIIVDGSPFVLLVPSIFIQFLQSSDDYYERYFMAFAVRMVRYLFFILALTFPSIYIAITTYHQEMLPTTLLMSVAGAQSGVPFPALIEAFIMELMLEALREAGVRLPKTVGQAVSIVGALVIGEAAVSAGIVSPLMVIVVATTAIASFTIPGFSIAISVRLLRFPLMLFAATLGFYGIMIGLIALLIHLCKLESFGIPYLSPLAPLEKADLKDTVIRVPWWSMKKRPTILKPKKIKRR